MSAEKEVQVTASSPTFSTTTKDGQEPVAIDPAIERRILRKLDLTSTLR